MSDGELTHSVVICTRDRPAELRACLASIAEQSVQPSSVHVVDASGRRDIGDVRRAVRVARLAPVDLVETEPNTAAQRNLGVSRTSADVVHFLDDDTILEADYLANILAVFADDTADVSSRDRILGVGGLPTNLPPVRSQRLRRLLASPADRPGAVLASGRGVLASGLTSRTPVDWLSGCCMSFRRSALLVEPFDDGGALGYVLGEDLELSYRVRQHGRLVVEPQARLVHLESQRNRWDRRRWAEIDVVNRRRRVNSRTGSYRTSAFWVDSLEQLGLWALRSLRPGASDARAMTAGISVGLVRAVGETGSTRRPTDVQHQERSIRSRA